MFGLKSAAKILKICLLIFFTLAARKAIHSHKMTKNQVVCAILFSRTLTNEQIAAII